MHALALAGTTLAGLLVTAPAPVTYDPATMTGFAAGSDVRRAFGWTDAQLAARASGVSFDQDFWTDDAYTVACGPRTFPVVHHREFGRFQLVAVLTKQRGAATGYSGAPTGFRITGARSGISGTSVAPAAGQPCPSAGPAITAVRLVSTTTGWALSAHSGAESRELLKSS